MSNFYKRAQRRQQIERATKVLRSHDNREQLPKLIRGIIAEKSGIQALEGETIHDYLARATGTTRADLDRFVNLMEQGYTREEAEAAVPSARGVS